MLQSWSWSASKLSRQSVKSSIWASQLTSLQSCVISSRPLKDTISSYRALRFSDSRKAVKKAIANKLHTYNLMIHRLQQLDTLTDLFLHRNAFSLPRLLFLLRSFACYRHSVDYDECTRITAVLICNVQFDDTDWKQAKLPIRLGGLGLRSAGDLDHPTYFSSHDSSRHLVSDILPPPSDPSVESANDAITTWKSSALWRSDDPVWLSIWYASISSHQVAAILSQHRLQCFLCCHL